MSKSSRKRLGFTFLEILTVLIIVSFLSLMVYFQYTRMIEREHGNNAKMILKTIRSAQLRYYTENGTFAKEIEDLDLDEIKESRFEYKKYFDFKITTADDKGFTVSAIRLAPSRYEGESLSLTVELDESSGEIKTDELRATSEIYKDED